MSHASAVEIDMHAAMEANPISPDRRLSRIMWFFVALGFISFLFGWLESPKRLWSVYYVNLLFWMGLTAGGCMIPVIFQIVGAKWCVPVRRIAEANVAFLPWAFCLFLISYFGKEHLFYWAQHPMPGREWWMQAEFVYVRNGLLLAFLFYLMHRFVRMSVRGDVGYLREKSKNKIWQGYAYQGVIARWQGSDKEVACLQKKLNWNAPALVMAYATIYSLFSFEMIMGIDPVWYSNMFGGFNFVGNIYMGWCMLVLLVFFCMQYNRDYSKVVGSAQFWDLGKLCFGFCMMWGYLFFAQFLPQWYGNLPEETQWLMVRTREFPWKIIGWMVFSLCFVIPFILLLSRDLKRTPQAFRVVCIMVLIGMWLEKYVVVMPSIYPDEIPFFALEFGLFFGFMGVYILAIQGFLAKYPFLPISHPNMRAGH